MRARKRYYQILQVPRDAPPADVKKAYRALAKRLHPDRLRDPELARKAEDKLKEINAAWNEYLAILKNGGEDARHPHPRHRGGRDSAERSAHPASDDEEDWSSQQAGSAKARGAYRHSGHSSRERYRAERARAARDRVERERRAREQADQVRRDREAELYEFRAYEGERLSRLVRVALAGVAAPFGMCLVLLVAFLLFLSFR